MGLNLIQSHRSDIITANRCLAKTTLIFIDIIAAEKWLPLLILDKLEKHVRRSHAMLPGSMNGTQNLGGKDHWQLDIYNVDQTRLS